MTNWDEFTAAAPRISTIFTRRHTATGNLCFLGSIRKDGSPRISPMEPRMFEGHLVVGGMPNTRKFADLARDPRFELHTATTDTHVGDGDAKLWGTVTNLQDEALHQRFAQALYDAIGFDLRGEKFDPFYVADISGASSVEVVGEHLEITVWKPGEPERTIEKH